MSVYEVRVTATVRVEVNDPDVIDRVVANKDNNGRPEGAPGWDAGTAWRNVMYADMTTVESVVGMLAYNAVANGRSDAHMDGWADLPRAAAAMYVTDVAVDDFDVELVTP